jgi:hypothetical protein
MTKEAKIQELAKTFSRWMKDGSNGKKYDRIYFNAEDLGLKLWYYKTGNISDAEINGESISNCEARRIKAAKAYLDIETWTLHIDKTMEHHFGDAIRAAIEF